MAHKTPAKVDKGRPSDEPAPVSDRREDDEYGVEDHEEDGPEAMERQARAAPVHGDHGLDPVTTPWDISRLAGYGDGEGHDAMMGIDHLVMGRSDAMAEASVESFTDGGPLELDPFETLFSDDAGFGDMGAGVGADLDADWTAELQGRKAADGGGNKWFTQRALEIIGRSS